MIVHCDVETGHGNSSSLKGQHGWRPSDDEVRTEEGQRNHPMLQGVKRSRTMMLAAVTSFPLRMSFACALLDRLSGLGPSFSVEVHTGLCCGHASP